MATIVHVTESLGGGVLAAMSLLLRRQVEADHRVILLHTNRPDTPSSSELNSEWFDGVERHTVSGAGKNLRTQLRLAREIRRLVRSSKADFVHLHSTFAGIAGRVIRPALPSSTATFYSPHGFTYTRTDLKSWQSALGRLGEAALTRMCDGLILVCESEQKVARRALRTRRTAVLTNRVDLRELPSHAPEIGARPRIVCVGRLARVKAPWRFAELSRALGSRADFVWIGGTDSRRDEERWIGDSPVRVTGWLRHGDMLDELSKADVILMTSSAEGLPIALMEAQAMGIPAVGTDIDGIRDIVRHGETGYLATTDEQFEEITRDLIADAGRRNELGKYAQTLAVERFSAEDLSDASLGVYRSLSRARGIRRPS